MSDATVVIKFFFSHVTDITEMIFYFQCYMFRLADDSTVIVIHHFCMLIIVCLIELNIK